jgi:putative membrane protein
VRQSFSWEGCSRMPMMWGYSTNYASMALWMLAMLLFWLGLAALVGWALIRLASQSARMAAMPKRPSALAILDARYARGEIDAATFREMRTQLLPGGAEEDFPALNRD